MCGFVALLSKEAPISPDVLAGATRVLHHRGPDAQRHWLRGDGRVGLGHARLSIIDLHTGDQPLTNEDESLRVVVNGEFYDFQRIRRELEERGHRFHTRSDSEIVLHLYEEYGPQCLHHLRGEFALVLWDERNRLLFAARDRFGIKPLFYARHGDTLYFASEAKALFAAGVPARWDHESVFQFHHLLNPLQDRTLFQGVYQVPPGHYALATQGQFQLLKYWDFDYPSEEGRETPQESESYVERFRTALDEAIRLRLHADVPVGLYLSGGLDSCAVLGLAQRQCSRPLHAFTLGFDRPEYDESALAEEMARKAGASFTPIPVRQEDLADHFADAVWHGESFLINANSVAKFMLSRAVRKAGYKVVLTGEGSDEVLAGYPHFRRDMLLHDKRGQPPAALERALEELRAANRVSRGTLLPDANTPENASISRVLGFVPSFLASFSHIATHGRGLFAPEFAAHFAGRDAYRLFLGGLDVRGQLTGRAPVNQSLYLWSKCGLPNYVLSLLGDRMEMAHSIEGRLPFLDHPLVELARTFPVSQKIRGMTEKYVLREAARPVLTEAVYRRQKHPFMAPPSTLSQGSRFYELVQDTLRGPAFRALPFYEPQKFLALLDQLPGMDLPTRNALDPILLSALSACVLQQRFGLQPQTT
ncbi:asparagine synthase (glutamine-hydrolyzing) [Archangium violaceum]|uniref:asparagine synthase (glutamine-hydrolyzing) n=1 Tax=Archangium violaceum TaxID=83451 RepID=UPI002B2883B7|nr:asparagine synthase (glutamine-hydrolyzing) [Archangium violaceum]